MNNLVKIATVIIYVDVDTGKWEGLFQRLDRLWPERLGFPTDDVEELFDRAHQAIMEKKA